MASNQEVKTKRAVGKKYVIACDGTWENSDAGTDKGGFTPPTAQIPTNVTRIARAMAHRDSHGIPQIVYYQRGVGTDSNLEDQMVGGLTGDDLSEHVREAYAFLANNFEPESQQGLQDLSRPVDDIVLLGFSRGAFTARTIASLISDIGLLTRIGMESFWGIFGDWMRQDTEQFCPWFASQFGEKIKFTDPRYRNRLKQENLTRWGMPIRAVGVWDTVGALGVPMTWGRKNVKEYSFVNAKVAPHVLNAFHALALDEHRFLFTPTLWEEPDAPSETPAGFSHPHRLAKLKQTWFPGVHANIGGAYEDAGISNISLAWMISQLEDTDGGIITFNPDYLDWVQDQDLGKTHRPWGLGKVYDSSTNTSFIGIAESIRPTPRTPGRYYEIDNSTGQQIKDAAHRMKNTCEAIHPCVRIRMNEHGLSAERDPDAPTMNQLVGLVKRFMSHPPAGVVEYCSPALANYTLIQSAAVKAEHSHSIQKVGDVIWKAKDGLNDLPEDMLGGTEIRLLERSVECLRKGLGTTT